MVDIPNIPNKAPEIYVTFTAEITPATVEPLSLVVTQAIKKNIGTLYLAFSTSGGQVQAGISLYSILRAAPFKLVTHNISSVDSIGGVIFLAGDERYAVPHSSFMFHGVAFEHTGLVRIDEQFARNRLDTILADQAKIKQVVTDRTSISDEDVENLFLTQRTVDSDWAKSHGLIHDIRNFNVPGGRPIISVQVDRSATR